MKVVSLCEHRNHDVEDVLRELLELASSSQIQGLAFIVRVGPGDNRAGMAGEYRRHPEKALRAASLLKKQLTAEAEAVAPYQAAI